MHIPEKSSTFAEKFLIFNPLNPKTMARSLRMIAPFDVLTGNISGTRKLKYNDKMNPAWDAPDGQQYARNYKPRYVGIYHARTGKTTFSVKEKSATNLNAASRRRMAAMGGTCAMFGENGWRFPLAVLSQAQLLFTELRNRNPELTYRKAFFEYLYNGLLNRQDVITIPGMPGYINDIQVGNPWAESPSVTPMGLSDDEIFFKFFTQLAPYGKTFTINGKTGYYYSGWEWTQLDGNTKLNVIPVTMHRVGNENYVIIDDHAETSSYVGYMDGETFVYCKGSDQIGADDISKYITTTTAPQA